MKRIVITLVAIIGFVTIGYGVLYLMYGDFAEGVIEDGQRMAEWRTQEGANDFDTCRYSLKVPVDIDMPETRAFDTTIVRTVGCKYHLLHFPTWGTGTTYKITGGGVEREVGFVTDEEEKQWLDIAAVRLISEQNQLFRKVRI